MRIVRYALLCPVLCLAVVGCGKAEEKPGPVADAANLNGRLAAAANISVPQARNPMVGTVARDAAGLGQIDICVAALGKMSVGPQRRTTAQQCAEVLTKKGDAAGATRVAAVQ